MLERCPDCCNALIPLGRFPPSLRPTFPDERGKWARSAERSCRGCGSSLRPLRALDVFLLDVLAPSAWYRGRRKECRSPRRQVLIAVQGVPG